MVLQTVWKFWLRFWWVLDDVVLRLCCQVMHMCCFDRCRMRCNLDVLPEWKRLVVESPLMLVSVFYVEYFLLSVSSGFRSCAGGLLYVNGVYLLLRGMNFGVCLRCFCGLDRRGAGRLLGCTRYGGMCWVYTCHVENPSLYECKTRIITRLHFILFKWNISFIGQKHLTIWHALYHHSQIRSCFRE
jgi:hypothetical protein